MAFDEKLAERVREGLTGRAKAVEKKMFGGLAFLVRGNMCVGVHQSELIVRIDPDATDAALAKPHVRLFDITGRPMKGWILVGQKGLAGKSLDKWLDIAVAFVGSLPKKA